MSRRLLVAAIALLPLVSCIGPQAGHREGYEPPTGLGTQQPVITNIRGFVRDANTKVAVPGVIVDFDGLVIDTTNSDGSYALGQIYRRAGNLTVAREGYAPSTVIIALNGGDLQRDFLIVPQQ